MKIEQLPGYYLFGRPVRIGSRIYRVLFRFKNWHLLIPIR